jgi:hypothetical protein
MIALFWFSIGLIFVAAVMAACDFYPDKDEDMS